MRMLPEQVARYWISGGEIFSLGGPLPLVAADGSSSAGCRILKRQELRALALWHRREAASARGDALRHHRLCLRDALASLTADRSPLLIIDRN